ncbi:MAG: glycosyltransferase family 4 protein, partial [Lachnospiraceae bacterium]|nr:glycosyltransferase family 4 protein [Lachnospiraceae bacterium]
MKIAIDLTSLNDNFTGLERYAYEVSHEMIKAHPDTEFICVFKGEVPGVCRHFEGCGNVSIRLIKKKGKLYTNQFILPVEMKKLAADAYYYPAFPIPLLFHEKNTYVMVADTVCFDMPETMKTKARLFWSEGLKHSVRVCRGISVNSEYTLSNVAKYFPGNEKKAVVAYCGVDTEKFSSNEEGRAEKVRERYGLPERYNLSLCTIEPRKNLKLLLDTYAGLKRSGRELLPLVLSGRAGWKYEGWFDEAKAVLGSDLVITGFIDDEDLPYVYRGADTFIFPTRYEGFGMPPLEALAAGAGRVLVSDIRVMKEVLGDTAVYFKENDRAA